MREYERWLSSHAPSAIGFRWLMGSTGQLLTNGPALRLPTALRLDPSTRLLDVGSGRGGLARAIDEQLRPAVPPVAIDYSGTMLRLAARDGRHDGSRVGLVRATGTALPFADARFTLVTCGHVAKHLDDRELRALLGEIRRVLEPGGLAVLWEFGPSGNPRLDRWNTATVSLGVRQPRLRSSVTLQHHALAAGFDLARDANLRPFLAPPIPRASVLLGRPPEGWRE
ncbi:MAG: class I SAM-dependent methyltransferase [Chloroflexi bacterium]|nr:class I SAM-dependent methyltransferase [Chloroflexota bacterium]